MDFTEIRAMRACQVAGLHPNHSPVWPPAPCRTSSSSGGQGASRCQIHHRRLARSNVHTPAGSATSLTVHCSHRGSAGGRACFLQRPSLCAHESINPLSATGPVPGRQAAAPLLWHGRQCGHRRGAAGRGGTGGGSRGPGRAMASGTDGVSPGGARPGVTTAEEEAAQLDQGDRKSVV